MGLYDDIIKRKEEKITVVVQKAATSATTSENRLNPLIIKENGVAGLPATNPLQGCYKYQNSRATASNTSKSRQITQQDVDDYRNLGVKEVHLHSNRLKKEIYIVLEKTGQDRIEFLPEEILKLSQAKNMFDGVIVDVGRSNNINLGANDEGGKQQMKLDYG